MCKEMKIIASNMCKYEISEHGLPVHIDGKTTIDDQIAEMMSHGKAKPGRILIISMEICEKDE